MKFRMLTISLILTTTLTACGPTIVEWTATAEQAIAETQTAAPSVTPANTLVPPTPTSEPTPVGGGGGLIVFTSNRSGLFEIHAMDPDGSNQMRIVEAEIDTSAPEFSPDGNLLLLLSTDFAADPPVNGIRFFLGADGLSEMFPFVAGSWSPDSQYVLVTHTPEGAMDHDLGLVGLTDGSFTALTSNLGDDTDPDWCAELIVFTSTSADGEPQLMVMDADGNDQRPFAFEAGAMTAQQADWSPDCSQLLFVSGDIATSQIYVVAADGSNLRQLTDTAGQNREPAWSPDGRLIAFWSDRSGDHEIFVMNADGSHQINLTNSPGIDKNPTWLPEFEQ